MTVADNTSRNQYTATSGQTVFAYTFEIVDKDDIVVLKNGTTLSEGTNYTVSNVGNDSGGNVTLAVGATAGDILTLYRDMPYARTQNYTNSGDFLASEVNADFDELWLAGEQTNRTVNSAVRKPITDAESISMELPDAATRASKYLRFTDTGAVTVATATTTVAADSVLIDDAGNYYDSDNVEGALQEIGADLVSIDAELDTKAPINSPSFQGDVSVAGNILVNGTVDGRDVAADGTKLDTVETNADVTDTANVTAAGAVMDSELTDEAAVKALNQGVATTDSPTFVGLTTTETATISGNAFLLGTGFSNDQTTDIQSLINAADPYSTIRLIGEFSYTALTISTEGVTLVVDGVLKQFSTTTESNSGYIQLNADYVNIKGGQFDGNTTPSVIVKINTGADYCTVRNAVFKNIDVDNTMAATSGDFGAVVVSGDFARVENCTFTDLTNTQDPPNRINDSWPRGITVLGDDCVTNSLSFFRVQCPHTITGNRFQSFDAYMEEIEDNGYYLLGPGAIITNPVIINCSDEPFVFGAPSDDCRVLGGYIKNHANAISFDRTTNIVIDGLNVDSTACASLFKTRNTNTTYGQTITAITQASQAVVTANAHGLAAGVEITITGANPADYNGTHTVVSKTTNTLTLDLNSSSFGAYTGNSATLTSEGQGCRNIKIRNLTAKVASLYEPIQFTAGTVRDFLLENSNIQYAYSKNDRSLRAKNITQALEAEVETPSLHRFTAGMTVTIANATPSGYNGSFTIQSVVNNKKFTINLDSRALGAYVESANYGATASAANVPYAGGADATDFSDGYFLKSADMQDFIVRGNTFRITDGNAENQVTQYKFTPVSTNPASLKVFSNNQIITESATGDTRMNVEYADFDSPFMFVQPSTGVIRDYENTLPMFWSSAAPSAGTYKEGTIIFNSDTDEGGNVGWVYVSGAWQPFSRIGDEGTVTADNFRTNSTNDGFNLFARDAAQTAVYIQQAGTGNILDLQTGSMDANAGVSRFLVDNSGRVGIGTSPSTILDINTTGTGVNIQAGNAGSDIALGVGSPSTANKVVVTAGGKVGILESSPAYELDVNSTIHIGNDGGSSFTHSRLILDSNGASRAAGIFSHNQVNDTEWFFGNPYDTPDSFAINRLATASHSDSTANKTNSLVTVNSSGNVGIGGTFAGEKLEVYGNIRTRGASTEDQFIEIGHGRTGNGYSFLDLVGDTTYTDYGLRIIRNNGGANTTSVIQHRGTGDLQLRTDDSADMSFSTAATERMRIDAAGNVGIGTTSPTTYDSRVNNLVVGDSGDAGITIFSGASNYARLQFAPSGDTGLNNGLIGYDNANDKMSFATAGSDRMYIDNVGNVGIGTQSPNQLLTLGSSTGTATIGLDFETTNVSRGSILYNASAGEMAFTSGYSGYGGYMTFDCNGSERMRIDSSGNLLVGTTNTYPADNNVTGHSLTAVGQLQSSISGYAPFIGNRKASDGDIAVFKKDGTTVGSIGVVGGDLLYIGTSDGSDAGLNFDGDNSRINPCDGTGAATNGALDLGQSGARFKDLYLSGDIASGSIDAAGESFFGGSLGIRLNSSAANSIFEGNSSSMVVRNNGSNNINYELGGSTAYYTMNLSRFSATTDNARELGSSGQRWSTVYAATGSINTSDERLKQQVRDISNAESKVAKAAKKLLKAYKYNDAVEAKGDGARWHIGIMAQELKAAFEAEGLDAHEYGMFCWNEWWEADVWHEDESLENGGYYQREIFDSEADAPADAVRHDRYSIRYEELLAFIIASI